MARGDPRVARELEAPCRWRTNPRPEGPLPRGEHQERQAGMLVDKILANSEPDVDLATRCYLAWSNSLRRDLEARGLQNPRRCLRCGHTLAESRGDGPARSVPGREPLCAVLQGPGDLGELVHLPPRPVRAAAGGRRAQAVHPLHRAGTAPSVPATEAWSIAGRRSGKSFILSLCAVYLATFRDRDRLLGEGAARCDLPLPRALA